MSEQDHPIPAESEINVNLHRLGVVVALVSGFIAVAGAWFLLPYRVDAVEKRTTVLETKIDAQQQLLIRIDENVKQLKEQRH
jgi:hypothetical protein